MSKIGKKNSPLLTTLSHISQTLNQALEELNIAEEQAGGHLTDRDAEEFNIDK